MEEKKRKTWLVWPLGLLVGLLNGFFGAGGGMAGVPMLRSLGLSPQESHATCIAVILPLAALSGWLYLRGGHLSLGEAWIYLPGGALGALCGGWLLPRLRTVWLRRVFGVAVLFAAVRLLLR